MTKTTSAAKSAKKETGPKIMLVQTGKVQEVAFKSGMTPNQVFAVQGWKLGKQNEVRLNGKTIKDLDIKLKANDMLMVVGEIAGG